MAFLIACGLLAIFVFFHNKKRFGTALALGMTVLVSAACFLFVFIFMNSMPHTVDKGRLIEKNKLISMQQNFYLFFDIREQQYGYLREIDKRRIMFEKISAREGSVREESRSDAHISFIYGYEKRTYPEWVYRWFVPGFMNVKTIKYETYEIHVPKGTIKVI